MKSKQSLAIILWLLLAFTFAFLAINKLTYLEFSERNHSDGNYTAITNMNQNITYDFNSPYQILSGFSFLIGTFARDNNSAWLVELYDKDSNKLVAKEKFSGSPIADNQWHYIDFGKLWIDKTKNYELKISALNVAPDTALAFYSGNGKVCVRIFGSDFDFWWLGLVIFCSVFVLLMILRFASLEKKNIKFFDDNIFCGMLICCAVFALLFFFKARNVFIDENDNMNGGFLIARGRVLYRDYVTQHTPFAYYLCSLFALFGAKSIEQFRLSFYLLEGIVFGLLYIRHSVHFGKIKMSVLPLLEIIVVNTVVADYGHMILSDSIEGICFVALLLEFLRYYDDGKIDWSRAIIVSLCIWFSFGSAFVSAFALVWIFLAVVFIEVRKIAKKETSFSNEFAKYTRLVVSVLVPVIIAALYFKLNHSFKEAVRQFYLFNRRVYPLYGSYGQNVFSPFVFALINYCNEITNRTTSIIDAKDVIVNLTGSLILAGAFITDLNSAIKTKKILPSLVTFLVMIMSGTRGYGFHGIAAWNVAVLIVVLNYKNLKIRISAKNTPVFAFCYLFLCFPFLSRIYDEMLKKQSPISDFESMVIDSTNDGEKILLDGWVSVPNYMLAKNRLPVNKALYMLPWYMDWYEDDTIVELIKNQPRFAIFNENAECWGHRGFTRRLYAYLNENYTSIASAGLWEIKLEDSK